jgi:hypothetical protein
MKILTGAERIAQLLLCGPQPHMRQGRQRLRVSLPIGQGVQHPARAHAE